MSEYDTEMAIACAYAELRTAERRWHAEECAHIMRDLGNQTTYLGEALAHYNYHWAKLTGLPNHWEEGPYTADNMPEIPKAPSSCTGGGPYDDADALAQLEE